MMSDVANFPEEVDRLYQQLKKDAEAGGYHLNPDADFVKSLINGLLTNQKRYGYLSCPCRLASGDKTVDLDIICPCDYRDPDLAEFGACYCALYVSQAVLTGIKPVSSIPERRPPLGRRKKPAAMPLKKSPSLSKPVWRCRVCGYLCARDQPPEVCPICKAKGERFERFM
jgi:ferredoxin-thioredoxin reductase catalytic chain